MTISEKIQRYRKSAGLSQEELAKSLLVSRQTISLWENGQTLPTIDNLIRLREIFGVSLDDMLCADEIKRTTQTSEIFDEEYSCETVSEMPSEIKKAILRPAIFITSILTLLLFGIVLYGFQKQPGSVLLNLLLLALAGITLSAIVLTVFSLKLALDKAKKENGAVSVKLNDDIIVIERKNDEIDSVIKKGELSKTKALRLGRELVVVSCCNESVYLKYSELSETSRIHTMKKSAFGFKRIITVLLVISFITISTFFIDLSLSKPLNRAERYLEIKIPEYVGISENYTVGLIDGIYIDYSAEIFLDSETSDKLNKEIENDTRWYSSLTQDFPLGVLPEERSYRGAEHFIYCEYKESKYVTVLYFKDENMLRVILSTTN